MLDDAIFKALGGNINYDFSVIMCEHRPVNRHIINISLVGEHRGFAKTVYAVLFAVQHTRACYTDMQGCKDATAVIVRRT